MNKIIRTKNQHNINKSKPLEAVFDSVMFEGVIHLPFFLCTFETTPGLNSTTSPRGSCAWGERCLCTEGRHQTTSCFEVDRNQPLQWLKAPSYRSWLANAIGPAMIFFELYECESTPPIPNCNISFFMFVHGLGTRNSFPFQGSC